MRLLLGFAFFAVVVGAAALLFRRTGSSRISRSAVARFAALYLVVVLATATLGWIFRSQFLFDLAKLMLLPFIAIATGIFDAFDR